MLTERKNADENDGFSEGSSIIKCSMNFKMKQKIEELKKFQDMRFSQKNRMNYIKRRCDSEDRSEKSDLNHYTYIHSNCGFNNSPHVKNKFKLHIDKKDLKINNSCQAGSPCFKDESVQLHKIDENLKVNSINNINQNTYVNDKVVVVNKEKELNGVKELDSNNNDHILINNKNIVNNSDDSLNLYEIESSRKNRKFYDGVEIEKTKVNYEKAYSPSKGNHKTYSDNFYKKYHNNKYNHKYKNKNNHKNLNQHKLTTYNNEEYISYNSRKSYDLNFNVNIDFYYNTISNQAQEQEKIPRTNSILN